MHTAERFFVIGRSLLLFMHTCPVTEFAVASQIPAVATFRYIYLKVPVKLRRRQTASGRS